MNKTSTCLPYQLQVSACVQRSSSNDLRTNAFGKGLASCCLSMRSTSVSVLSDLMQVSLAP